MSQMKNKASSEIKPFLTKNEIEDHWRHNIKNSQATKSLSETLSFADVEIEFGDEVDEESRSDFGALETFGDAGFPRDLLDAIQKFTRESKLDKPTVLQAAAIPFILKSSWNLEICSSPGMGKTLLYALPILDYILRMKEMEFLHAQASNPMIDRSTMPNHKKPYALIVVPNYMLARQIGAEIGGLANILHYSVSIYLADKITKSIHATTYINSKGCDIVIGTAGRIRSSFTPRCPLPEVGILHTCKNFQYALESVNLRFLVYDDISKKDVYFECFEEAIRSGALRVISVGAEPLAELRPIIGEFSAQIRLGDYSLRSNVEFRFLQNPIFDGNAQESEMLKKARAIYNILRLKPNLKTLIFVSNTEMAKILCTQLHSQQCSSHAFVFDAFDGQKETITAFRTGVVNVLVASDEIFSRGIHIPQLSRLIIYDLHKDESLFWRCVGRCGRMGAEGIVWTFMDDSPNERRFAATVGNICLETDVLGSGGSQTAGAGVSSKAGGVNSSQHSHVTIDATV